MRIALIASTFFGVSVEPSILYILEVGNDLSVFMDADACLAAGKQLAKAATTSVEWKCWAIGR